MKSVAETEEFVSYRCMCDLCRGKIAKKIQRLSNVKFA